MHKSPRSTPLSSLLALDTTARLSLSLSLKLPVNDDHLPGSRYSLSYARSYPLHTAKWVNFEDKREKEKVSDSVCMCVCV